MTLTTQEERFAALRAPFPESQIGQIPRKTKSGSTIHLDYVGHADVTDRLLTVDPEWTWEPMGVDEKGRPAIQEVGADAVMWIRLTVLGVTRIGVGTVPKAAFDLPKQLISDALRNAAMRFGVALDLWAGHDLDAGQDAPEAINEEDAVRRIMNAAKQLVAEFAAETGDDPVKIWDDFLADYGGVPTTIPQAKNLHTLIADNVGAVGAESP